MDAREKPLAMILVKRASIFMCVICAVSVIYWVIGSASAFLDQTQLMLLRTMKISALGIVAFSGIGAALSICYAALGRYRLRAAGLAAYLAVIASGTAVLYLAQSVLALSWGLR